MIDLTNSLDTGTTTRLKEQLAALEQRKGAQVAVLLVPSIGEASIEDYANQLFRAWKLGHKDVNDGILLLVAKEDRKVRIEVGHGLEGTVPTCWPTASLKSTSLRRFARATMREGSAKAWTI